MHKCASVDAMTKQTRQFGERAMQVDIKTHHICGNSTRKNPQKTHHVVTKNQNLAYNSFACADQTIARTHLYKKMTIHSATCVNQFVKMIVKTHHVVAKNKIASVFAPPFVAPSKRPLRNYTQCAQRTILQK